MKKVHTIVSLFDHSKKVRKLGGVIQEVDKTNSNVNM